MIFESRRYVVLAGYRRRSLLPAPCDAYLILFSCPQNCAPSMDTECSENLTSAILSEVSAGGGWRVWPFAWGMAFTWPIWRSSQTGEHLIWWPLCLPSLMATRTEIRGSLMKLKSNKSHKSYLICRPIHQKCSRNRNNQLVLPQSFFSSLCLFSHKSVLT